MYQLFVDESYQKGHYYVAGVLVDEKQSEVLATRLDELADGLRERNNWLAPPEFHGHALMNGLDDWKSLNGNFGACVAIYQKVLHVIYRTRVPGSTLKALMLTGSMRVTSTRIVPTK